MDARMPPNEVRWGNNPLALKVGIKAPGSCDSVRGFILIGLSALTAMEVGTKRFDAALF